MTQNDYIKTVKANWKTFRNMPAEHFGDLFFNRLFLQDSSLKQWFPGAMNHHYIRLYALANYAVKNFEELNPSNRTFFQIFNNLIPFPIISEEFKNMRIALIWTIEKGLDNEWNSYTQMAWNEFFNSIENIALLHLIEDNHTSNEIKHTSDK